MPEAKRAPLNPDSRSRPPGAPPPAPPPDPPDFDPPPPLVPNAETIEAIEEARRGELTYVGSIEELKALLDRDYEDETLTEVAPSRPAAATG